MEWSALLSVDQFHNVISNPENTPVLIFKHSKRCHISGIAKLRLNDMKQICPAIQCYLVDVIGSRSLSRQIADAANVSHESPQVLLFIRGECVYDESHLDISVTEIKDACEGYLEESKWRVN